MSTLWNFKVTFSKSDVESLLKQQVLKKKYTHTHTHTHTYIYIYIYIYIKNLNKIWQNTIAHQSLEVLNLCSMKQTLLIPTINFNCETKHYKGWQHHWLVHSNDFIHSPLSSLTIKWKPAQIIKLFSTVPFLSDLWFTSSD